MQKKNTIESPTVARKNALQLIVSAAVLFFKVIQGR